MAKVKDLTWEESETWLYYVALRDAAGQPLDLTGATVTFAMTSTVSGGASLTVTSAGASVTITNATAGLATISIAPATHAAVPAGEYSYEITATLADATVSSQLKGSITVGESVVGNGTFGIVRTAGLQLEFDTATTDADPGDGEFRFNHATPASATFVYIDLLDRFDVDITDWIAALDDSTTTAARGHLRFVEAGNEAVWHEYLITGAVVTATGYRKIPVSYIDGNGSFTAADIVTVLFSRTGNTGAVGADGTTAGIIYDFSTTTTDADPGVGLIRANNASLSTATELYIDDEDTNGNNQEAFLVTWDDSTSTVKGHLIVSRASDKAQVVYQVNSLTDAAGYVKVGVTYVAGSTAFSAADVLSLQFYRAGNVGATGSAGANGTNGTNGTDPGVRWLFDTTTTTTADPGAGDLRLNNATLASVTEIALSDSSGETGNPSVEAFLATWDDSTNTVRGHILIKKASAPQNFAIYRITGAGTDEVGWWRLPLAHVASSGSFSAADVLSVQFYRAGDAGTGDVVGPASATDNALVRFDTTTGKLVQNSTVTLDDTGAMTFPEMAAPATPAAGKVAIYAKSDGLFYSKDDAGTESPLSPAFSGALGKKSASQTAANYTTLTAIAWDAETYDEGGWHDNATNNERLTVPAGVTRVRVSAQIHLDVITAAEWVYFSMRKNGLVFDGRGEMLTQSGDNAQSRLNIVSAVVAATAGDYFHVELQVESDTSITVNATNSWFAIEKVS